MKFYDRKKEMQLFDEIREQAVNDTHIFLGTDFVDFTDFYDYHNHTNDTEKQSFRRVWKTL